MSNTPRSFPQINGCPREKIRGYIASKNTSVRTFSIELGIPNSTIDSYLKGTRGMPIKFAVKIQIITGISAKDILLDYEIRIFKKRKAKIEADIIARIKEIGV